eukprot:NODE_214_length_2144_cov_113.600000_g183_i0.p1 GENE.NODE_214_length_2144_cov_113.600000_g183_i0~~NODE_214_length_2144_cov_113.600000_g183_i0.p1  ORF type:complete len:701 (-),score=216.14 NODE_214_length_2144_cov_113.600000_g183_i0:42-2048(-)
MLLKLYVMRKEYFRNPWNWVDASVVVTSVVGMFLPSFKVVRSLRTIRVIVRLPSLQAVVHALAMSVPGISHTLIVMMFIWLVFGILGVQLFKGHYYYCDGDEKLGLRPCEDAGHDWKQYDFHFDHIAAAMLTLVVVSIGEGWSSIMWNGIDSTGTTTAPRQNAKPLVALYFVFFVLFAGFFAMNLFTGLLIDEFSQQHGSAGMMTDQQRQWVKAMRMTLCTKLPPPRRPPPAASQARRGLWKLAMSQPLEYFITGCIVLNILFMACEHYQQTQVWTMLLRVANYIFVSIFTTEALLKLLGLGPRAYFEETWNVFDLVVVVVSLLSLPFDGPSASGVRMLRIARVFRLARRAETLHRLFTTLVLAIPSLFNICLLLVLIFFLYGVTGVQMFGRIPVDGDNPGLTRNSNFRNLYYAIPTLYQISTTETWPDIMHGARYHAPGCDQDCGTNWAYVYFPSFVLLAAIVMLNAMVTVVVENFSNHCGQIMADLEELRDHWAAVDTSRDKELELPQFMALVRTIPNRLLVRIAPESPVSDVMSFHGLLTMLRILHIPLSREYTVLYKEVVAAFGRTLFSLGVEQAAEVARHAKSTPVPDDVFCVHHWFACRHIIAILKRRTIQRSQLLLRSSSTLQRSYHDGVSLPDPQPVPPPHIPEHQPTPDDPAIVESICL